MGLAGLMKRWQRARRGVFAVMAAMVASTVALGSAATIDLVTLNRLEQALKQAVDQGALAAARAADDHARAGEEFFDFAIRDNSHRFVSLERWHNQTGDEHTVRARGEMKPIVLGLLGLSVVEVGAESVALSAAARAMVPCLSIKAMTGIALHVGTGTSIGGEGCVLVLESDEPALVSLGADASLDMEGFCVRQGGRKPNIEALSARLDLPFLPEFCEQVPERAPDFAGAGDCGYHSFDQFSDFREIEAGRIEINGGVYCATFFYDRMDVDFTIPSSLLEARGGALTIDVSSLNFNAFTFVGDESIMLRVDTASRVTAPESGPYGGYSIVQRPGGAGGDVILDERITIDGWIYAPAARLTVENGASGEAMDLSPLLIGSGNFLAGSRITLSPREADQRINVMTARPRLIR